MQSARADSAGVAHSHDEGNHREQQTHAEASDDKEGHEGDFQDHNSNDKRSEDAAFRDAAQEANQQNHVDQQGDEQGIVGSAKELGCENDNDGGSKSIDFIDEASNGSLSASATHKLLQCAQDAGVCPQKIGLLTKKINDASLVVAVLALVKAGKSTLMNAMIGQEFLPAMPEPETAVLVRVRHDPSEKDGQLLDRTGHVVCTGRGNILQHLTRMNSERRERALKTSQPPAMDEAGPKSCAVVFGHYELEDRSGHLALQQCCDQSDINVYVTFASQVDGQGKKSSVVKGFGRVCAADNSSGKNMQFSAVLKSHCDSHKVLYMTFTANGLQYSIHYSDTSKRTQRKSAHKHGCARVLRAKCIDGNFIKYITRDKGVERWLYPREGNPCEDKQYWYPGDAFAVRSVSPCLMWIEDFLGGWVRRFSKNWPNTPYFEFMTQNDTQVFVPGEPVKIVGSASDSPLDVVAQQPTSSSSSGVKLRHYDDDYFEVGVESLQPVESIVRVDFCMDGEGVVKYGCPAKMPKKMPVLLRQHSCRSVLFETQACNSKVSFQQSDSPAQLEDETMTLLAPIQAFQSPTVKVGNLNMELMDTPGPNEANVALDVELQRALRKADVILYVLDYSKIGTEDEATMFKKLQSEHGRLMDSIDSRFWFLLNKIDVMNVNQDLDVVLKSVAGRVSLMCGTSITPDRIMPISSLEAFLGRQGLDVQRVSTDETFQEEFLKNAVKMYKSIFRKDTWVNRIAELAPQLIEQSRILDFETRVFHSMIAHKSQILSEKVCFELKSSLCELNNSVTTDLKSLQSNQEDLSKQIQGMQAIQSSLQEKLCSVKEAVDKDNYRSKFLELVDKNFSKMRNSLEEFISALFLDSAPTAGHIRFKSFIKQFDPSGRMGSYTAQTEEDIKVYLKSKDELMLSVTEHAYAICSTQLSLDVMLNMPPWQKELRQLAQPVLDYVLRETGSALDIHLVPEKVVVSEISDIDLAEAMDNSLKVQPAAMPNKKQIEATRFEKKPWRFLWLIQIGTYDAAIKYMKTVTESYTVNSDALKQRWLRAAHTVTDHVSALAHQMLNDMVTSMVSGVTDAIKERVDNLLATLNFNKAGASEDKEAVARKMTKLTTQLELIQKALKYEGHVSNQPYLGEWELVTPERHRTTSDVCAAAAASQPIGMEPRTTEVE